MLAEPQTQDKEALRTNVELSSSDPLTENTSRFNKYIPYFVPIALYQIIAGCLLSFSYPSYFHICLAVMGCISLALLGIAYHWNTTKENVSVDPKYGRTNLLAMLVCAVLKLSTTPLVLSNISFQKSYMLDYRAALSSDPNKTEISILYQSHFIEIFEYIMTAYAFTDIALLLFSLPLVIEIFRSLKHTGKIYTSFNFIFNTIMLSFSLTLICKVLSILNLPAYSPLASALSWHLSALIVYGGLGAGLSLAVWLVNARKWRIGYFTLSVVFIVLSICFAAPSSYISSYANEIYSSYSDTTDLKEWRLRMLSVPQEEIEAYGCPAKYIAANKCNRQLIVRPSSESPAEYCLNQDCAGLLGHYYSDKFSNIGYWGFTMSLNTAVLAFSLLYYSLMRRQQISPKKLSRHYKWLILLGIVALAHYFTYLFSQRGAIQDHNNQTEPTSISENIEASYINTLEAYSADDLPDEPKKLNVSGATVGGQPIIVPHLGYLNVREASNSSLDHLSRSNPMHPARVNSLLDAWTSFVGIDSVWSSQPYILPSGSLDHLETTRIIPPFVFAEIFDAFGSINETANATDIDVSEDVKRNLNDMIVNQTYSYVILGLNPAMDKINILDKGKTGNANETISKLNDTLPKIAILGLPVDTLTKYVIVVYAPDNITPKETEIYNNSVIPQAKALTNSLNIPVLITNNSTDLQLKNVLKYTFDWPRNENPQFKTTQIPTLRREGLLKSSQQNISSMVFRLKGNYIGTDVEKSLNEVVVEREYRYILLDWNTSNLLTVIKKAPKNTTHEEFLRDLVPGKSQLALLDFQVGENKEVPVLVSWSPELIYTQQWQTQVYELVLNEVNSLNIPYLETNDITALSVESLTDFLNSFWSAQVNSYSKFNSKELLSIFENLDANKDPETLLGPFYQRGNATGESFLTDMLLRRTYKYILFKEVQESNGETKLIFNKTAPIETSLENFFTDVRGNGNQLALLYLDFLNLDKIVCLAIINQKSLEKNYVSYARIAAATEVYDIPMAYVSSPEKIDIEQLTLFTFAPEVLHMLDQITVDPTIQTYWTQFSEGVKYGYITFGFQDNYSKIKLLNATEGFNVTYQNFTTELNDKQSFFAIVNLMENNKPNAPSKPMFVTWIPQGVDLTAKIMYKQAEVLLFPLLPGSEAQQKVLHENGIVS